MYVCLLKRFLYDLLRRRKDINIDFMVGVQTVHTGIIRKLGNRKTTFRLDKSNKHGTQQLCSVSRLNYCLVKQH